LWRQSLSDNLLRDRAFEVAKEPVKGGAGVSCRSALLALLLSFATAAWPQKLPGTPAAPSPPAAAQPQKDPFGRETPQGLVHGLMKALGADDYERALQFFQTTTVSDREGQPALSGPELARTS